MKNKLTPDEFNKSVQDNYKKIFKNGWIQSQTRDSLGEEHIVIKFGLTPLSAVSHGIIENDPMYHTLFIHGNKDFSKSELEAVQSGLMTKPEKGSYLAMKRVKTKLRKTKGDLSKLDKTLNTFFSRLGVLVKDQKQNIHNYENYKEYIDYV